MPVTKKPFLISRILYPVQEFMKAEAFSGILLMLITLIALAWANSPWAATYSQVWNTKFSIGLGEFGLSKPIILWINDGLMAIFFFVVGLEIKREMLTGELASLKQAAFPVIAAIGGMVVPASIFAWFNYNLDSIDGWGIPMATDIAFALGILTLLGKRVPLSLKLFLVAFAIVDDIGAVLVIALFYTAEVNFLSLWIAFLVFGILLTLNALQVRNIWLYILLGIIMWVGFLNSGVHATITGILLAITIPSRSKITEEEFISSNDTILGELTSAQAGCKVLTDNEENFQAAVHTVEKNCEEALSPLRRLEHALHPWVAYAIMPIFALANAGIFIDASLTDRMTDPAVSGIVVGLLVGKPVGIVLFTWLASVTGLAAKPTTFSWRQLIGAGMLGGIGFTMAIFIANLAFADSSYLALAKFSILGASLLAGLAGYFILLKSEPKFHPEQVRKV